MALFDSSWETELTKYEPEDSYTSDVKELERRWFDDSGDVVDSSYISPNVNISTVYMEADPNAEGLVDRYSFQDYFTGFSRDVSLRFSEVEETIERKVVTAYKVKGNAYYDEDGTAEVPCLFDTYVSSEAASAAAAGGLEFPVDVSVGFVYNVLDSSIWSQVEAGDNYVVVGYEPDEAQWGSISKIEGSDGAVTYDGNRIVSLCGVVLDNLGGPVETQATIMCTNTAGSSDLELNKTYTNAEVTDLLKLLLNPYVAPKDLAATNSSTKGGKQYATTNCLYGTSCDVTPQMTATKGSMAITKATINGTSVLGAAKPDANASVGEVVTFTGTTEKLKESKTFYCYVSDGKTELGADNEIYTKAIFWMPYYIGTSTSHPSTLTASGLGTAMGPYTSTSIIYSHTVGSDNEYFWIALPSMVTSVSCIGGKDKNSLSLPYDMVRCGTVTDSQAKSTYNIWTPTNEAPVKSGTAACFKYVLSKSLQI